MQIVNAFTDACHGRVQRILEGRERFSQIRLSVCYHECTCLQQGTGEQMPYIVMDGAGNAVAFRQRGNTDPGVLILDQGTVSLLQGSGGFLAVILGSVKLAPEQIELTGVLVQQHSTERCDQEGCLHCRGQLYTVQQFCSGQRSQQGFLPALAYIIREQRQVDAEQRQHYSDGQITP